MCTTAVDDSWLDPCVRLSVEIKGGRLAMQWGVTQLLSELVMTVFGARHVPVEKVNQFCSIIC